MHTQDVSYQGFWAGLFFPKFRSAHLSVDTFKPKSLRRGEDTVGFLEAPFSVRGSQTMRRRPYTVSSMAPRKRLYDIFSI